MNTTTQLNIRLSSKLKAMAQKKAIEHWTNLNFLIKLFLYKFINNVKVVEIKQDIDLEKIFDEWFVNYYMSDKWKNKIKKVNRLLEKSTKNERKYLV
jgi:hypothetical protein